MGAFDLSFPAPAVITDFNSFLGGLGEARQQAGAQQAQLTSAANLAQQQAWAGAIGQVGQGLTRLGLAPFVPALARMAGGGVYGGGGQYGTPPISDDAQREPFDEKVPGGFGAPPSGVSAGRGNPYAAMIAGNLLGLPGLTQAGQLQAYGNQVSALHDQAYQQQYASTYGFTPQQAPDLGRSYYNALPGDAQAPVISSMGFTPDQFAKLPPSQQNVLYSQMAQQASIAHKTAPAAVAQDQALGQLTDQVGNGQVVISDPSWAQKWQELNGATDNNAPGWAQPAMQQQLRGQQQDLVRQMQQNGVLQPKIDPAVAAAQNVGKQISAYQQAGLDGETLPVTSSDGKTHMVKIPSRSKGSTGNSITDEIQPTVNWGKANGLPEVPIRDAKGGIHMLKLETAGMVKYEQQQHTDLRNEAAEWALASPQGQALVEAGIGMLDDKDLEDSKDGETSKPTADARKRIEGMVKHTLEPQIQAKMAQWHSERLKAEQIANNQPTSDDVANAQKRGVAMGATLGHAIGSQQQQPVGPQPPPSSPFRPVAEMLAKNYEPYVRGVVHGLPKDFGEMDVNEKADAIEAALKKEPFIQAGEKLPPKGQIKNRTIKELPGNQGFVRWNSAAKEFHPMLPTYRPHLPLGPRRAGVPRGR